MSSQPLLWLVTEKFGGGGGGAERLGEEGL